MGSPDPAPALQFKLILKTLRGLGTPPIAYKQGDSLTHPQKMNTLLQVVRISKSQIGLSSSTSAAVHSAKGAVMIRPWLTFLILAMSICICGVASAKESSDKVSGIETSVQQIDTSTVQQQVASTEIVRCTDSVRQIHNTIVAGWKNPIIWWNQFSLFMARPAQQTAFIMTRPPQISLFMTRDKQQQEARPIIINKIAWHYVKPIIINRIGVHILV